MNKRALEELICGGAFDFTGAHRAQLLASYESMLESKAGRAKNNIAGQLSLFGDALPQTDTYPNVPPLSAKVRLAKEKEALGIYMSGHPLDAYKEVIAAIKPVSILSLKDTEDSPYHDRQRVEVAGLISGRKNKMTKNNALMAFLTIEDLTSSMEVIVFPKVLTACDEAAAEGAAVLVRGTLSLREEEEPKLLADEIRLLPAGGEVGSSITIKVKKGEEGKIDRFYKTVLAHPGMDTLYLAVDGKTYKTKMGVSKSAAFLKAAAELFGTDSVKGEEESV